MSSGRLQLEAWDDLPRITPGTIYEKTWFYKRHNHEEASGFSHYRFTLDAEEEDEYQSRWNFGSDDDEQHEFFQLEKKELKILAHVMIVRHMKRLY